MFSMVKNDLRKVSNLVSRFKATLMALLLLCFVFLANSSYATVTLPETGVDMTEYITAGIAAMGVIVAAALGGYIAFLLIRKAFRWLGKAIG